MCIRKGKEWGPRYSHLSARISIQHEAKERNGVGIKEHEFKSSLLLLNCDISK